MSDVQSVQEMLSAPDATAKVHWRLIAPGGEGRESPRWRVYLDEFVLLGGLHHRLTVTLLNEVASVMRGYPGLLAQFGVSFDPNGPVFQLSVEDAIFIANATPRNGRRQPSSTAISKAMVGEAPHQGF